MNHGGDFEIDFIDDAPWIPPYFPSPRPDFNENNVDPSLRDSRNGTVEQQSGSNDDSRAHSASQGTTAGLQQQDLGRRWSADKPEEYQDSSRASASHSGSQSRSSPQLNRPEGAVVVVANGIEYPVSAIFHLRRYDQNYENMLEKAEGLHQNSKAPDNQDPRLDGLIPLKAFAPDDESIAAKAHRYTEELLKKAPELNNVPSFQDAIPKPMQEYRVSWKEQKTVFVMLEITEFSYNHLIKVREITAKKDGLDLILETPHQETEAISGQQHNEAERREKQPKTPRELVNLQACDRDRLMLQAEIMGFDIQKFFENCKRIYSHATCLASVRRSEETIPNVDERDPDWEETCKKRAAGVISLASGTEKTKSELKSELYKFIRNLIENNISKLINGIIQLSYDNSSVRLVMQQLKFEEEVMKSLPCTQAEFYRTCKEAFRDVGKQTNYAQSILQSEAKMATQKVNRAAQKTKKEQKGELQEPAIQNNQAGPSTSIDQQDQQTAASGTGPGTRNRKPAAKKPAAAKPKGKKKANDAEKINMPEIRPSRGTAEKRKSPAPHDTINNPRLGLRARTRQGGGIAATSMPQDAVSVNKLNPKIHRPVVPNGQGSQLQQARHFTQQSGVNAPMYLPQTQDQSHQYPHDPRNPQHRHGPHVQNSNPFSNFNQPIPNPGQWNYQTQNHPGLYTPSGTRASMDPRNIHDQFPPHGYNG